MAGIIVNSVDVAMEEGETDNPIDVDGLVKDVEIAFAVVHTAAQTSWRWKLTRPADATADLVVDDDLATARLRPDVGGAWGLTCWVNDDTMYSAVLNVLDDGATTPVHGQRLVRRHPANVLTPRTGSVMFLSSVTDLASEKLPDETLRVLGSGGDVDVQGHVAKILNIPIDGSPADGETFRYSAALGHFIFGA